jgi:hypothetical protein
VAPTRQYLLIWPMYLWCPGSPGFTRRHAPDSAGENGVSGAEMCGRGIVERYRLGFPLQSEWGPWIGTGTFHEAPVM